MPSVQARATTNLFRRATVTPLSLRGRYSFSSYSSRRFLPQPSSSSPLRNRHLGSVFKSAIISNHTVFARNMASAAAKRLEGKTIVITGASSGIGKSTALEFARTNPNGGLRLILTARRLDSLEELAAQIRTETKDGVKVLPVKLDVTKADEIRGFVAGLPEEWRDIHVLVNNA